MASNMDEFNETIDVDMNKHAISRAKIKTDSLSTCLGLLLDGVIEDNPFCFISHSCKIDEDEGDDLVDLLVFLLEKLTSDLRDDLEIESISSQSNAINNLKLLVAGGAIDEYICTRKAWSLLNENISLNTIKQITNDADVIYLFQNLQNSVKIIKPVTYLLSNDDEDEGK